jgi:hypothetical protein
LGFRGLRRRSLPFSQRPHFQCRLADSHRQFWPTDDRQARQHRFGSAPCDPRRYRRG